MSASGDSEEIAGANTSTRDKKKDRARSLSRDDFGDLHVPVAVRKLDDLRQRKILGLDYLLIRHAHLHSTEFKSRR